MPPLLFLPPRLPLSIARPRFAAFLSAFGAHLPAAVLSGPALDLARACWALPATPELAEASDLLDLLSTPEGYLAITDASRAAKRALPLHLPAADLAAVLLTLRVTDPSLEPVVERALLAFARIVPRELPLELVAREPRRAADPERLLRAIQERLGPRRFIAAWHGVDDAHSSIHFAVVRRGKARAAFTWDGKHVTRRARRSVEVDVLRLDVADGRIVIRCDDPSLETAYAEAAGAALFDDAAFFAGDSPAYTFKSVVLLGSEGLAARRPPGVSRIRVVEIVWDDGEGITHTEHGSDALAAFEKRGGASGGYVTSMMFRIDAPLSPRPTDVVIRLPDRALYRTARHERLARSAIASLGAHAPGSIADDSFTLAPWIHAEWRWRKVMVDAAFEGMKSHKMLVPAKTRMVGGPKVGKYGWSYVSFDLQSEPGKKYAVAMSPGLPSRDLERDELRMWKLDPAAVARALAERLVTEPAVPDAIVAASALDLGLVRGGSVAFRIFALLRSPGPHAAALAEAMVRAAGAAHAVVILPEGRTLGASSAGVGVGVGIEIGLSLHELFGQEPIAAKVLGRIEAKKGLAGLFDAWRLAAPDARFVCEEKTGRMWLDRHELVLREAASKILLRTAMEGGAPVPTATLARYVAPNRTDDGVVRQTVPRLGGWIRECFTAKGKTPPEDVDGLVVSVANKGWRMTVKCEVR